MDQVIIGLASWVQYNTIKFLQSEVGVTHRGLLFVLNFKEHNELEGIFHKSSVRRVKESSSILTCFYLPLNESLSCWHKKHSSTLLGSAQSIIKASILFRLSSWTEEPVSEFLLEPLPTPYLLPGLLKTTRTPPHTQAASAGPSAMSTNTARLRSQSFPALRPWLFRTPWTASLF